MMRVVSARVLPIGLAVALILVGAMQGCAFGRAARPAPPPAPPQAASENPAGGAAPDESRGPTSSSSNGLPFRRDGDAIVFGPFSSWARGIDWFWCGDGVRLIMTVESEGTNSLWLIDAGTGRSNLLRKVTGIDAIFPVSWAGDESVVCIDLAREFDQSSVVSVTAFSDGKGATRSIGEFTGWLKRYAATPDGGCITIHFHGADGGCIRRISTLDGSFCDLLSGLPTWDGLFPVWFSPDGRTAVIPEPGEDSSMRRLQILDIEDGGLTSIDPYMEIIDSIAWNPGGSRFAHKMASGDYRMVETGDSYMILSGNVRIVTSEGRVLREIHLPRGHAVGEMAWLDDESLVLREMKDGQDMSGPVWFARMDGEVRPAETDEARAFEIDPWQYPMPKGRSGRFTVGVRSWQDPDKPPSQELAITPRSDGR